MAYPTTCQRLRINGTITDAGPTGGTVVESYGTNLVTHDEVLGLPGRRQADLVLPNKDGARSRHGSSTAPGKPWDQRYGTLHVIAYSNDEDGLITALNGRVEHLEGNMDRVLSWFGTSEGLICLERDFADPATEGGFITRYLEIEPVGVPASVVMGPVFGSAVASWTIAVPWKAPFPFWQEGPVTETVIGGATPIVRTGTAPVIPILEFTADGYAQHNQYSARATVAGVTGTRIVDCQKRTVTEGGDPAACTFTKSWWMRLPGKPYDGAAPTITMSGSGSPVMKWREAWF